jgi:hypothetical protein
LPGPEPLAFADKAQTLPCGRLASKRSQVKSQINRNVKSQVAKSLVQIKSSPLRGSGDPSPSQLNRQRFQPDARTETLNSGQAGPHPDWLAARPHRTPPKPHARLDSPATVDTHGSHFTQRLIAYKSF